MGQRTVRLSVINDTSTHQYHDLVEHAYIFHRVRGHYDRAARLGNLLEEPHDSVFGSWVEPRRWLVKKDTRRLCY